VSSISLLECGTRILSSCSKIQKRTFNSSLHGENSRELPIARHIKKFGNPFEEFFNLRQRGSIEQFIITLKLISFHPYHSTCHSSI